MEKLKNKNTEFVVLPVEYDDIAWKSLSAWLYNGTRVNATKHVKSFDKIERIINLPRIHATMNTYMRCNELPVKYECENQHFSYPALMSGKINWHSRSLTGDEDVIVEPTKVLLQINKEDLAKRITVEQFFKNRKTVGKSDRVLLFKKGKKNGQLMSLTKLCKQFKYAKIMCYLTVNKNSEKENFDHVVVL